MPKTAASEPENGKGSAARATLERPIGRVDVGRKGAQMLKENLRLDYAPRLVLAYETGAGCGMGTRDSAQDTLGTVHNAQAPARTTLSMLWHLQYKDGHTWPQVLPLTFENGPGLALEFPAWPQWSGDKWVSQISDCATDSACSLR